MTTLYIILDAVAAATVRGPTQAGHSLEPVLLADGVSFALPAAVLADPAHTTRHALLASAPQREVVADEWKAEE